MPHYSRCTEKAYVYWCRAFIQFRGIRHPASSGAAPDVTRLPPASLART